MYDLKAVMSGAWKLFRDNRDNNMTFATALKLSWACVRGYTRAYIIPAIQAGGEVVEHFGFEDDADALHVSFVSRTWLLKGAGWIVLGGRELYLVHACGFRKPSLRIAA